MICKYFLTVCGLPFRSLNSTFQKAEVLNFLKVFLMWIIFKVFIEFVLLHICYYLQNIFSCCFIFCFLGHEASGILALWPGIELMPLALEIKVLTTGLPVKFPEVLNFDDAQLIDFDLLWNMFLIPFLRNVWPQRRSQSLFSFSTLILSFTF